MKIFLPARHGLGDVLHRYFIDLEGRRILARVRAGLADGRVSSAMIIYEHFYNPSTGDLLRSIPLNIAVKRTGELPEVKLGDSDNRMPETVCGHQNVFTSCPPEFEQLDGSEVVDCPTRIPVMEIPSDFILFSDGAKANDRRLTDMGIYSFLRETTGLPVLKVGRGHDVVPADINLCERLHITETLYLASRARLVVSGLTMFRTCSSLFGTPVIELAEHPTPRTLDRTDREYRTGSYGMSADLNQWFRWPAEQEKVRDAILAMGRLVRR